MDMWPATLVQPAPRLCEAFDELEADVVAKSITRMMHDGIAIQDVTGRVVYCNDKSAEVLRMTPATLLASSSLDGRWESVTLDGEPYPGERHPAMQAVTTGENVRGEVMGVRCGDSTMRWLSIDSTPIDLPSGRYAITVFTDITDALEGHRQLRRTHAEIQNQLIQADLPSTRAVRFRASYRASGVSRGIGGDFYGAHQLGPDQFTFFIGDVCGHGVRTAGLSATARNTLRALGRVLDDPSESLEHLHHVVQDERPDSFLTAAFGRLDLRPQAAGNSNGNLAGPDAGVMHIACAGHPLPLLVRGDVAFAVGRTGPLVGMVPNEPRPVEAVRLRRGDRVVLHTDGVLDDAVPRITTEQLAERIPVDATLDGVVDWMMEQATERYAVDADHADDAAVLAFEVL